MKKALIIAGTIFTMSMSPCFASSLPVGEIDQKVGIGIGPTISVDFKLSPQMSLGASFGSPFYRGKFFGFEGGRYDIRLLYKFVQEGKFSLSGLIGAAGDPVFNGENKYSLAGMEIGVALSYEFTSKLTGRLNLVSGLPLMSWNDSLGYLAPAAGIELGYKFTPTIEGTIGGNGQGDFLGLNIYF